MFRANPLESSHVQIKINKQYIYDNEAYLQIMSDN